MVQIEGTYYGLGDFTVQGKYKIKEDIYSFLSIDNGYCEYPPTNIIATNTFKTKNQYNSLYTMEHDDSSILAHARQYVAVDCCNN